MLHRRPTSLLLVLLTLLLSVLLGCGSSGTTSDAALDGSAPDGGTLDGEVDGSLPDTGRAGPLMPACEDTEMPGTVSLPLAPSTLVASVRPSMARVMSADPDFNPALEDGELHYTAMGMDQFDQGPGVDRVQRVLASADTTFSTRRSLAWFVQVSDLQLADDESPARFAGPDSAAVPGGLRPQEAYLARAISAMSRTLTDIESPARPYDFGIFTGDCADSGQLNELRWVIGVLDGQAGLETDSGEDDDPIPGPGNDPKDPFDAVAFPAPWLYVPGNHDLEVSGVLAVDADQMARALGTRPLFGTRDYRQWAAPVTYRSVPADPMRKLVHREDIVAELVADTSTDPGPPGHGFHAGADVSLGANYAHDAIPGLLRILALDSSDLTGGSPGLVTRATVDGWLLPELARAETDGVLVILASHHSTTAMDRHAAETGPIVPDAMDPREIEVLVAQHPQVIAWIVGHNHDNRVRMVAGADAAHPGYWEIMTSAIADWPEQARFIELVDNGNGTLSIFGTLVDYATETCMERRYRRLSLLDYNSAWVDDYSKSPMDSNVELVLPMPAGAATAVAAATGHDRLESETTLRGMP